ncbi:hypothetical protein [Devosia enhydra]|uniref:hypothetical protein n=1 Tax=Devosia enhydra TaxID=665118 RepID=UPI0015A6F30E|nr:hypothetical protein [Devosia enhydra]
MASIAARNAAAALTTRNRLSAFAALGASRPARWQQAMPAKDHPHALRQPVVQSRLEQPRWM